MTILENVQFRGDLFWGQIVSRDQDGHKGLTETSNYTSVDPNIRCEAILEAQLLGDLSVHDLSGSLVLVDLSWVLVDMS